MSAPNEVSESVRRTDLSASREAISLEGGHPSSFVKAQSDPITLRERSDGVCGVRFLIRRALVLVVFFYEGNVILKQGGCLAGVLPLYGFYSILQDANFHPY